MEQYLNWILMVNDIEEIRLEIEAIIDRENNIDTINSILNGITKELASIEDLLKESTDVLDIEDMQREKEKCILKKDAILNVINEYEDKFKNEEKLERFGSSGVLFATNKYGNIILDGDLKRIKKQCSSEVYDSFISLIEKLMSGENSFIDTKQKSIQTDNDLLKGLYEMKDYQSRLLYRYAKDKIVIIGATIKKTTLDKKYRMFCVNAKEQSNDYVKNIEENKLDIDFETKQAIDFYSRITKEEGMKYE